MCNAALSNPGSKLFQEIWVQMARHIIHPVLNCLVCKRLYRDDVGYDLCCTNDVLHMAEELKYMMEYD